MKLTKQNILDLLVGKTHTLDLLQGGTANIFYETASCTFMQLPNADTAMRGAWEASDDGYHCEWENGPSIDWHLKMEGQTLSYFKPDGTKAGSVVTTQAGDVANLKSHFA